MFNRRKTMVKMGLEDKDINLLIVSYLNGDITHDELIRLRNWIDQSPENRGLFNELKNAWTLSGKKQMPVSALNFSWIGFREKIENAEKRKELGAGKRRFTFFMQRAATWLIIFSLGSILTLLVTRFPVEKASHPVTVVVPLGAKSNITLPDGSSVWLNAGTTLSYDADFGKSERRLLLTGEGYFDVARDKSHPFVVQTSGMVVRALGTRFNVKAYPDEKTISATLEEGIIDVMVVEEGKEKQPILLRPKEKVVFFKKVHEDDLYNANIDEVAPQSVTAANLQQMKKKDTNVLTNVNTELYTSWKDARWIISAEQLGTLATALERKYNLKFVFEDPELKSYKFSGSIENETVDQIMDALRMTAPLAYSINKDTVTLRLDTQNKNEFKRIMTR